MPWMEFICLANSRKSSARCVAGIRTDGQGWVRPVSTDHDGVLTFRHYRFRDGTDAGVLDVVRMVVKGPAATEEQPENWLVAPYPWQLVSRPMGDEYLALLAPHIQSDGALLGNLSDRISAEELASAPPGPSLALVLVDDLAWRVGTTSRGNRQVRAVFQLDGHPYALALTDPVWEQRLRALPIGEHPKRSGGLDAAVPLLLTISRSRNFDGSYYKLVAAMAPMPGRWRARLLGHILPNFGWLLDGELAGMSRPRTDDALALLPGLGVRAILSLTERPLPPDSLARLGLIAEHVPVADFSAPTLAQVDQAVAAIDRFLAAGRPTVVHCGAGLGRTGTILACHLVSRGAPAADAVARVRAARPGSVETAEQEAAVSAYERHRAASR